MLEQISIIMSFRFVIIQISVFFSLLSLSGSVAVSTSIKVHGLNDLDDEISIEEVPRKEVTTETSKQKESETIKSAIKRRLKAVKAFSSSKKKHSHKNSTKSELKSAINNSTKSISTKNDTKKYIFSKLDANNKRVLTYYGLMLAGAVARSAASTAVHPLNVVKTMLQTKDGKMPAFSWEVLSRGAGSQFIMSIPHGAINFAVTEVISQKILKK